MTEKITITYKTVEELVPYINNPRKNDGAVDAVASSIKNFGFKVPIVIDSQNEIITGHTRLKAALKLGLKEVPCIVGADLTDAQIKAFRIADNKVSELSTWDFELLECEMMDLDFEDMGFSNDVFDFEKEFKKQALVNDRKENRPTEIAKVEELMIDDEIWETLQGEKVYFTFSGGRDSATTIYLMAPLLQEKGIDFELIFVDTGVEIPSTQEYIIRYAEHFGYPLKILRDGPDFFEYYEKKKQWPNAIYRDCIMQLIGTVAHRYIKNNRGEGQKGVNIRGGRNGQATNLSSGKKFYLHDDVYIFNPLWDLEDESFTRYEEGLIKDFGIWEGYAKGFARTACWCCPFQRKAQYDIIKKELPFLWDVLKRKATEWEFMGATHLDRYLRNCPEDEIDELGEGEEIRDW